MYKKLDIGFGISAELQKSIDDYVDDLNYNGGGLEDVLRDEIDFWTKDAMRYLTEEQVKLLRDYYVWKGILKQGDD